MHSILEAISARFVTKKSQSRFRLYLRAIAAAMPSSSELMVLAYSLHDCLFFSNSRYYEVANRIAGMRYINVFPSNESQFNYRFVAYTILATLALKFLGFVQSAVSNAKNMSRSFGSVPEEEGTALQDAETNQGVLDCKICFEPRKNTASTPCGHLFCWDCILKYAQIKAECPICRAQVQPKHLVRVANLS